MDDNRSICAAWTQALILMQILEAKGGGAFFSWGSHGFFFQEWLGFGFRNVEFREVAGRGVFCVEIFMSFGSIIFLLTYWSEKHFYMIIIWYDMNIQ